VIADHLASVDYKFPLFVGVNTIGAADGGNDLEGLLNELAIVNVVIVVIHLD